MACINDFHFKGGIRSIIFALSESNLWFIPIYVGLILVSPLLNKAIDSLSKLQYIKVLILLTVCNVYLGYLHQSTINDTGHTIMQFIYLYFIGRYIAIHGSFLKTKYSSKQYAWMYIGTVLVIAVLSIIRLKYPIIGILSSWHYNSPFVLLASILFFMIFVTLKFRNRFVNYVASSALAVYLFHATTSGWDKYGYFIYELYRNASGFLLIIYLSLFVIIVFIMAIAIDKFRMWIMKPVENFLIKASDYCENKVRKYIINNLSLIK
jgi:surface polysaccharide O-acyltransferase-like enzyme